MDGMETKDLEPSGETVTPRRNRFDLGWTHPGGESNPCRSMIMQGSIAPCNHNRPSTMFYRKPDLDLSVVIVSYNAERLLRKCLRSIFRFQRNLSFEVIVIDNHSQDRSADLVRNEFPEIRLMENKRNLGFSAACNQGIRCSRGRLILLLNPDTEFTEGGITRMVDFMDSHRRAGICGPRMVDAEGKLQYSCRSFPSYLTAVSSAGSLLNRLFPTNPMSSRYLLKDRDRSRTMEVDWVSGSGLLTKREVFERIGLLDEGFFMYVEDVDLCYRAQRANISVYYVPAVEIVHHIGTSTRRRPAWMRAEHHRSMYHFYRKHHQPHVLMRGMVFLGICIRLWFTVWGGFFVVITE